jgi:hypothetical protein
MQQNAFRYPFDEPAYSSPISSVSVIEGGNILYLVLSSSSELSDNAPAEIQCLIRITPSIYHWYKTESEVATILYARHNTSLPVPQIYAFDSSSDSGFEWVLMEKMPGQHYAVVEDQLSIPQHQKLVQTVSQGIIKLSKAFF